VTKGDKVYEQPLVLQYPEDSPISEEERKKQYDKCMQLYRMSESLAGEVEKMDMLIQTTDEAISKITDKKVLKKLGLNEYKQSLVKTKEKMVVMSGDNYVGQAEPRLREKIASLYSEIISYPGNPSNAQLKNLELLQKELEVSNEEVKKRVEEANAKNEILKEAKLNQKILATPEIRA
jgi:hypothetical protein